MFIIMLGPPGAGKGTQARNLAKKLGVPHIASGDILREIVRDEKNELGKKIKEYMARGELVPDDIVIKIIHERLSKSDCEKGAILDGYPRTIKQAKALEDFLGKRKKKIDLVINLDVPDDVVIKRLTYRRICPKCNRVYHLLFKPPKNDEVCDICGVKLIQRDDDKEDIVRRRLEEYRLRTYPLIDYYSEKNILYIVNGIDDIDRIFRNILQLISEVKKNEENK
ncbi:MAG: adenylate kinase [Candidatus Asgardarchaeia archaeon]